MLKIKRNWFEHGGHWFDYELEDGTLLHDSEWNGECYIVDDGTHYTPIYELEPGCDDQYRVIGFDD